MYKTYAEIAAALGIDYCGETGEGHTVGYTSRDGGRGRIHWTERRVTRSGVRRFLNLAWDTLPARTDIPSWLTLWMRVQWVRRKARELHTMIPPELWEEDKARLAAKLVNVDLRFTPYNEEAKRALRWTQR